MQKYTTGTEWCQVQPEKNPRKSVFAIFIGFEAEITGKILKKHLIFSKNIIEIVRLQYHFSKTEFHGKHLLKQRAGNNNFRHTGSIRSDLILAEDNTDGIFFKLKDCKIFFRRFSAFVNPILVGGKFLFLNLSIQLFTRLG